MLQVRALLIAAVLSACAAPAEVVVVVQAEEGLRFAGLDLRIVGSPSVPLTVTAARPWTLGLSSHRAGAVADVTVHGTLETGATVMQQGRLPFRAGERQLLYFYLSADCAGDDGSDSQTCFGGERVGIERAPCRFEEPLPTGPTLRCADPIETDSGPLDAALDDAALDDAGLDDAGLDAGPPVDAGPTVLDPCVPGDGVCDVDVGDRHACAIEGNGEVRCWGSNDFGEIGHEDRRPVSTPTPVAGLSGARDVALGNNFSCVLDVFGAVRCFGRNNLLQLGRPSGADTDHTPNTIAFPLGVRVEQIDAGAGFACARAGGDIYCWGAGGQGQLGPNNPATPSHLPRLVVVSGADNGAAIGLSVGDAHACAWSAANAWCWGNSGDGRLAIGFISEPVEVAAGSRHTCVRTVANEVRCAGDENLGQLGGGGDPVVSLAPRVVAGADATCVYGDSVARRCWGWNPGNHLALTNTGVDNRAAPSAGAETALSFRHLAMGARLSCGISDVGALYCWGFDRSGGAGQEVALEVDSSPVEVADPTGTSQTFSSLVAGDDFTCARSGAEVYCWGAGGLGQHGDSLEQEARSARSPIPRVAGHATGLAAQLLAAGPRHTCLGDTLAGEVVCWGDNGLGGASTRANPVIAIPRATDAITAADVTHVGAGLDFSCWIDDANVFCIGDDSLGQGCDGSCPRQVAALAVNGLAVGRRHACASGFAGGVVCWGDNSTAALGIFPGPAFDPTPRNIAGADDVSSLAAGDGFTCGIDFTTGVQCWGANDRRQLGRLTGGDQDAALGAVEGLSGSIGSLRAGGASACAFGDTELYCWGDNRFGQLLPGGPEVLPPTALPLPSAGLMIVDVALGPRHRCATFKNLSEDETYCWGSDEDGRAGTTRTMVFTTPIEVRFL